MGIFSFMQKKKPIVHIELDEVGDWLESYLEGLGISQRVLEFRQDMKNKIVLTRTLLDKLASAQLANENIPARAKNIMKGNREQYITRINQFLDGIDIPEKYVEIPSFAVEFSENMETLAEDSQKNFFIIKEFFASEVGAVATKIKDMEKSSIDFRRFLEQQGIESLKQVRGALADFYSLKQRITDIKQEIRGLRQDILPHKAQIEKIESRLSSLTQSQRYKHVLEMQNRLETIDEEIAKSAREYTSRMSTLSRPLKKFARLSTRDKIIADYQKDPVETLIKDESLVLKSVLDELVKKLDKLGLKEQKIADYKELVSSMTKTWLVKQQLAVKGKIHEKGELQLRVKNDSTMLLVREQESWKTAQQEKIDDVNKEIRRLEDELESSSLTLAWQKVRDAVASFDSNVVVKRPNESA